MANYDTQPSYRPENKTKFTIENVDKFIIDHGMAVTIERSYLCTCRNPDTGQPDPDCPICFGQGFAFIEPVATQMLLQAMDKDPHNVEVGMVNQGTAIGTTTKEDKIAVRDRVSSPQTSLPQSLMMLITKQDVAHGVSFRYQVKSIDLAIMDGKALTISSLNVDYEKSIFYPTEAMIGKHISFNVLVVMRYYVIDILREGRYQFENDARQQLINQHFTSLPTKTLLRREDMFIPKVLTNDNILTEEVFNTIQAEGQEKPSAKPEPKQDKLSRDDFSDLMNG